MLDFHNFTMLPPSEDDAPRPRANPSFRRLVHAFDPKTKIEMLSRAEERRLVAECQETQSDQALHTLLKHHRPFVTNIAMRYATYSDMEDHLDDMMSEGYKALIRAITRFRLKRDQMRLSGFAKYHVQGAVLTYVLRNKQPFAFGTSSADRVVFLNLRHHKTEFLKLHGRDFDFTSNDDLALMSDITKASIPSIKRVCRLVAAGGSIAADEIEIHDPASSLQAEARIGDHGRFSLIAEALGEALAGKSPRDKEIFLAMMGQDETDRKLRARIAAEHGVTPERVGQIFRGIRDDLRDRLRRKGITSANS